MSCPWNSVVFYGSCIKISDSISNAVVSVKILFRPLNSDQRVVKTIRLDENTQAAVTSNLQKQFEFEDCELQEARIILYTEKENKQQSFLLIDLRPRISKACSFDFIANKTMKLAAREYRMQLNKFAIVRGGNLQMSGKLCFVQSSNIFDLSLYDQEVLIAMYYIKDSSSIITKFYICPYLQLNLSEYNSLMIQIGQNTATLDHINITSVVFDGFYILSNDVIAVCVGTYFDLQEKKGVYAVNDAPGRNLYLVLEYKLLTGTLVMFQCILVNKFAQFSRF